jgi:hypothetical protein
MADSLCVRHMHKALSCLEATPPDWLGAALSLYAIGKSEEFGYLAARLDDKVSLAQLTPLLLQQSHGLHGESEVPLCITYALQLGGFHQELVDVLRSILNPTQKQP